MNFTGNMSSENERILLKSAMIAGNNFSEISTNTSLKPHRQLGIKRLLILVLSLKKHQKCYLSDSLIHVFFT